MSPSNEASVRIALIDDDSGFFAVLDRRFDSLGWDRRVLGYAPGPDQLAAQRLHVVVVNTAITGLDYVERTALALTGLALLVCTGASPLADRVRGLRGTGPGRRPCPRARGDLPARVGLHDGPRGPLGRRLRAQGAPEARTLSPDWNYLHTQFGVGYRFAAESRVACAAGDPEPAAHPWPGGAGDPQRLRVPDREGLRGPPAYDPF
ncbi:MAG TPA: hypothetical protein VG294_14985 [Solirubrobacteraceae bacterium]|jgi:hypothetical protein|nr:hypothetical protein [Solirubrobacteraceae bacterium]